MAHIGLLAVDSNYPNLALMKISAYHKRIGDTVDLYNPFDNYDKVYMSKVFTFTEDYGYFMNNAAEIVKGGTGYDLTTALPPAIEMLQPDYSLYPTIDRRTAYGFLTRGCPNKCKWCVVPQKEGNIRPYMDIEDIAIDGRGHVILMDNNVLASDYGLQQIEKIVRLKLHVDFNQAIDARLVTPEIAQLLARVKWIKRIRFGCDTPGQVGECERAISLIDHAGYRGEYLLYCIILDDIKESHSRINHWATNKRVVAFAQPYRDPNAQHQVIPMWQKDLAQWANRREFYRSCTFADFSPRKGFSCKEYFNN